MLSIKNFFLDLSNFIKLKSLEKNFETGFFCENYHIFNYLNPYILNKIKKKNVLLISFEKINGFFCNKVTIFVFKTNFFRELVFLTLNLKYLYSSTPDLENSIFKKTKLSKCKYIYLQHSPVSLNLIYRQNAFDAFDAIQIISNYQLLEFNEIKKIRNLSTKIFKSKYLFIDNIKKKLDTNSIKEIDVLIAPSWNTSFYELKCHENLHNLLTNKNISYKLRPHPMSFKKKEISIKELETLGIKIDQNKNIDFNNFDFLISDWSGIFIEYSLIHMKKSYLINTPKKDKDLNYKKFLNVPVEISMRKNFSYTFEINSLDILVEKIFNLKKNNQVNIQDEKLIKLVNKIFY